MPVLARFDRISFQPSLLPQYEFHSDGLVKGFESEDKEIILMGDTNCDLKSSKNLNAKTLELWYREYQFEQMITDYTRIAVTTNETGESTTSKSLMDHFSTKRAKYIVKCGALEQGMADHYAVREINAWRLKRKNPKTI